MLSTFRINHLLFSTMIGILFLFCQNLLLAETFILKDGRILKGKLIQYQDESIEIQTEDGKLERINRNTIVKVQYGEDRQEEKPLPVRKVKKQVESPNYVARSAILPGFGLYSMGRKKEAYIASSLFFISALFVMYQRNEYLESKEAYQTNIQNSLILSYATKNIAIGLINAHNSNRDYEYSESEYNKAALLCGAIYLGQLFWTYDSKKPEATEKTSFEFHILPTSKIAAGSDSLESKLPLQVHFQYQFKF